MRPIARAVAAAGIRTRGVKVTSTSARVIARSAATAARSAVPAAAVARNAAIASVLHSGADAEDLAITLAGVNPAVVAGVVRPLAVVKVGGEIITKELPTLAASLKVMWESGIQPVVVHGGGPQLNDELAKAGVKPEYIGGEPRFLRCLRAGSHASTAMNCPPPTHPHWAGHRVTSPAVMEVAERVFLSANAELVAGLQAAGLAATPVVKGVFRAEVHDAKLGLVSCCAT